MKTSISYIVIFMLLTAVSVGFVWHQLKQVEIGPVQLSISLSATKGDFMHLFHRTKNENFSKHKKIKKRLVGDGVLRTFQYNLPARTSNVRVDLSQNQNQEKLMIQNISLIDAKGNSKTISGQQLRQLRFNKYCNNFVETQQGLRFETNMVKQVYHPQIEDLNIAYLLYYAN